MRWSLLTALIDKYFVRQYKESLSMLSLNNQTIVATCNEFYVFINIEYVVKIICLHETWLTNIALCQLLNYNLILRSKSCCQHGGMLLYIHYLINY